MVARKRWPSFEGLLVGSFDGQMTLYRVFDGEEMAKIIETGKVTGGKYSVPAERVMGASWAHDISSAIRYGNNARGARLGKDIYLAKMDAMDKKFLHLGPESIKLDPSVDEQLVTIPKTTCNLGLGCSVSNVSIHDVDEFFKVLPNDQIESINIHDLKTARTVLRRASSAQEAKELLLKSEEVASNLVAEAKAIRAAARVLAGILQRSAKGQEPSDGKDGPKWDEAVKTLDKYKIPTPKAWLLTWAE
jgi:hypothetical protein